MRLRPVFIRIAHCLIHTKSGSGTANIGAVGAVAAPDRGARPSTNGDKALSFDTLLLLVAAPFAILAFVFAGRKAAPHLSRRDAQWLGFAWVVLWSVEYWIAGDRSFLLFGAELEYGLAVDLLVSVLNDGARYLHRLAGGVDRYVMTTNAGQLLSLERILADWLPLGAANGVHKITVCAVGFVGTYRLSRSAGADRWQATLLASLFTLSHQRITVMTWSHGTGFAALPLGAYLLVARAGRRHYWAGVAAFAAFFAASCTPTHSLIALSVAVVGTAVAFGRWRLAWMALLALAAVLIVVVVNWHEGLFAKFLLGAETVRGDSVETNWMPIRPAVLLVGVAAALGCVVVDRRDGWRIAVALAFAAGCGEAAQYLTASVPLLAPVRNINFHNGDAAIPVLALLAAAMFMARARIAGGMATKQKIATMLLAGLVAGHLAWQKAYDGAVWLSEGGLGVLASVSDRLRDAPWKPLEPVRAVSVPYRLPANAVAAAGLDTFDGMFPLIDRRIAAYWDAVVAPRRIDAASAFLMIPGASYDPKCCREYRFAEMADVDLLRLANVGIVLSVLPLRDDRLVELTPPAPFDLPRADGSRWARAGALAEAILRPAPVRAYAIADPLPRVYGATDVVVLPDAVSDAEYFARVRADGLRRAAVVRGAAIHPGGAPFKAAPSLAVDTYSLIADGFDIQVTAPDGGVVIVNALLNRFWQAAVDGVPAGLAPVNGFQTAVQVPPGARRIELRYARPSFVDILSGRATLAAAVRPRP